MALLGGYEELLEQPIAKESSVPFICLTDDPGLKSDTWQIKVIDRAFDGDLIRSARKLKIRGHHLVDDFDETLWIDNTVLLKSAPEDILETWLRSHDIAVPLHSYRASVIAEVEAVIDAGRDDPARLYEQLLTYLRRYPEVMQQQPFWTGMMARRKTEAVRASMDTWWDHVARYSRRDQVSFPIATRSLDINSLEIDNKNSEIHRWPRALKRLQTSQANAGADALRPDVSQLGQLQNEIDRLTMDSLGAVNQREQRIDELEQRIDDLDAARREASSLRLHADALQRTLEDERRQQVVLHERCVDLTGKLNELHSSTSWRVSAPVRVVGGLARRRR